MLPRDLRACVKRYSVKWVFRWVVTCLNKFQLCASGALWWLRLLCCSNNPTPTAVLQQQSNMIDRIDRSLITDRQITMMVTMASASMSCRDKEISGSMTMAEWKWLLPCIGVKFAFIWLFLLFSFSKFATPWCHCIVWIVTCHGCNIDHDDIPNEDQEWNHKGNDWGQQWRQRIAWSTTVSLRQWQATQQTNAQECTTTPAQFGCKPVRVVSQRA